LVEVIRHNDQDVRSLARLLVHLEERFGDPARRSEAAAGDLAGLARAFAREQRLHEALGCLDAALAGPLVEQPVGPTFQVARGVREAPVDDPWWSPRRPADFGGPPRRTPVLGAPKTAAFDAPWTTDRIAMERAHLLRRLGRYAESAEAWDALAAGTGRVAIIATIEVAKLLEHRLADRPAALRAVLRGFALAERRRRIGRPEPGLERDLVRRHERLQRRSRNLVRRSIA
jgi:hypothetical protein